jgi:hypothetical protein
MPGTSSRTSPATLAGSALQGKTPEGAERFANIFSKKNGDDTSWKLGGLRSR